MSISAERISKLAILEFTVMKYPTMREELIDYLEGLSDKQYQLDCWVGGNYPEGVGHDELDYAVHFLFDDTSLSSKPAIHIGGILRDRNEANKVKAVCDALKNIIDALGDATDEQYVLCDDWVNVLEAAESALKVLKDL